MRLGPPTSGVIDQGTNNLATEMFQMIPNLSNI